MKLSRVLTVAAAVLAVAAPVMAQAPPGGQGGRRGFRGGRGFGLMGLASMPEVQTELKMDQAEQDLVKQLADEMRNSAQQSPQDFRSMSPEQRQAAFQARRAEEEKKLGEILNATQMHRLKQLELQQQGWRALERADVAQHLGLSADQKARIHSTFQAQQDSMRQAFQSGGNFRDMTPEQRQAVFQKMRQMQQDTDTKVSAILSDSQKHQFETMKGAAFAFPQRGFGRGGRGRRGAPQAGA